MRGNFVLNFIGQWKFYFLFFSFTNYCFLVLSDTRIYYYYYTIPTLILYNEPKLTVRNVKIFKTCETEINKEKKIEKKIEFVYLLAKK